MALVKLPCLLLAVLSLAWSIQGASFSSNVDKNTTVQYQNASALPVPFKQFNPQQILADLQAAASDNVPSVTGTTVTSTIGQPPSVAAPAYQVPSYAQSFSSGASAVPPGPAVPPPVGYPPAVGGFPLFPAKWGNFNLDIGGGGYFPIVEKVIVVVGGGIFLLLILALIQGSLMKGGALYKMGQGAFSSFSEPVDVQSGVSASAATSFSNNAAVNNRVQDSINKKF
jgi:hypothetical protein